MPGIAFRALPEVFFTRDVTGATLAASVLLRFISRLASASC
jgi:hypothetical protein